MDAVAKARNGKPKKSYRESLRPLSEEDIQKLLQAVLESILTTPTNRVAKVVIVVSYLTQFPVDFPYGKIIKRTEMENHKLFYSKRVLSWLNKHGYTSITPENIRGYRHTASHFITDIEKRMEI